MQRWTQLACLALFATAMGGSTAGLAAQETSTAKAGGSATQKPATPRPSKAAREALSQAAAIRKGATGKKGAERKAILQSAANAYAKVMADFTAEPVAAAPASYAAAEIWRAQGELDKAKEHYRRALELDAGRFAARAQLQLAHIARRQKDLPGALALYGKVATLEPKSARAHEARLWTGRCQVQMGKKDEAVQTFRAAIDQTPSPRQGLDACNRLANLLVKMGQLDAAEQAILKAKQLAESEPGGSGKNVARRKAGLTKAFASMTARKALQRARDKASNAHRDAQDVEKRR